MGEELEPEHLVNDPSNTITPENSDNCAKTDKRVEYVKMRAKNIIAYYRNFMIGLGADAADFKKDAGYKEFSITMQTGTDFLTGLKNLMSRNGELQSCKSNSKTLPTKSTPRQHTIRLRCIHCYLIRMLTAIYSHRAHPTWRWHQLDIIIANLSVTYPHSISKNGPCKGFAASV